MNQAPTIKLEDLDEIVHEQDQHELDAVQVRVDFIKVTSDTVLVPVTIQMNNKDITFQTKEGISKGVVDVYGRITTLTGKIAQTFRGASWRNQCLRNCFQRNSKSIPCIGRRFR